MSPLTILKQFTFSSSLQRMSVIAKSDSDEIAGFVKGSPEMITTLCKPESSEIGSQLLHYFNG